VRPVARATLATVPSRATRCLKMPFATCPARRWRGSSRRRPAPRSARCASPRRY
jgi:hypothetical protein